VRSAKAIDKESGVIGRPIAMVNKLRYALPIILNGVARLTPYTCAAKELTSNIYKENAHPGTWRMLCGAGLGHSDAMGARLLGAK
jgi:hypothetical protein